MDILFGEDVQDEKGRLKYILRGKYGMDLVVNYFFSSLATADFALGTAMVKLERLIKELKFLWYVSVNPHLESLKFYLPCSL